MSTWGFPEATFVQGFDRKGIDIQECVDSGLIAPEYLDVLWNDVQYIPEGKVACHLGHLEILRAFLRRGDKEFALIFEDDLEEAVASDLRKFLSRVPADFDLLHLGFVRENRELRRPVDQDGIVFRSAEALGRHAYMVTRQTARILTEHTLPMRNHGDQMFKDTYRAHGFKAYQPREPIFRQDRYAFASELCTRWKPQRAFEATENDDGLTDYDREQLLRHEEQLREEARAAQAAAMARQGGCQSTSPPTEAELMVRAILESRQAEAALGPDAESILRSMDRAELDQLSGQLASGPNPVLFVGVEGVLNAAGSSAARLGRPEPWAVQRLAKVVNDTGCFLVFTSDARHDNVWLARLLPTLERAGVSRDMVAGVMEPEPGLKTRAHEIRSWLDHNPWVRSWAVADHTDLRAMCGGCLADHFVQTDAHRGLQPIDVDALVGILQS